MSFREDKIGFEEFTFYNGLLITSYSESLPRNVDALTINTMYGHGQKGLKILKKVNTQYLKNILGIPENQSLGAGITCEAPIYCSCQ